MPASSLGVSEATKGRVRLQHRLFTERLSCVENHARPRSSVLGRAGMDFTLGCYKLSRARDTHRWPQSTWGRGVPEPRGSEHPPTRGSRSQSPGRVSEGGLEASCQGRPREGRLAEAGRKCLPGLVALEVLRDEGCPFPEEGTMAVWSPKPEPSLGGGRLGGEGQVSACPLHTHTGLKARGAVWSSPWPPLSDHGLRHGMTQEWGGGSSQGAPSGIQRLLPCSSASRGPCSGFRRRCPWFEERTPAPLLLV